MLLNELAICFFTKNNQKYIEKSLKSVRGTASEILIFDLGSTDKTKTIAKKYGKVFDLKYSDDTSKVKNEALKKITKNWVLFLEADEEFTKETQINLANFIIGLNNNKNQAFNFKIIEPYAEHINIYYRTCLFFKDKDTKFVNSIFEELENKDNKITYSNIDFFSVVKTGNLLKTKEEINKESETIIFRLNKIAKESKINDKPFYYYQIANTLLNSQKYNEALKQYLVAYEMIKKQSDTKIFLSENILVSIVYLLIFKLEKYDDAIKYIDSFLEFHPDFPEIIFYKALCLIKKQEFYKAKELLTKIIRIYSDGTAIIKGIKSFQDNFYFNIMLESARCSLILEEKEKAFFYLLKAYRESPKSREMLILAIIFYLREDNYENVILYYGKMFKTIHNEEKRYTKKVAKLDAHDIRKLNNILTIIDALLNLKSELGEKEKDILKNEKIRITNFLSRITVCVVSYQNGKELEECYKSILPIASEIITLDFNSNDETQELARLYGKLYVIEGFNHKIKNYILDIAKGEYVFFIQANQRISPRVQHDLFKFLYQYKQEKNVSISMNVTYPVDKGANLRKDHVVALMKLGKNIRFDEKEKLYSEKESLTAIKTKFDLYYLS